MKPSSKPDRKQDEEYRVGPGRPPKEYQFKPGQSGNPKGAKRKSPPLTPDLKEILESAFNQKVRITQRDRKRDITKSTAGMQRLADQFAKGDRHARRDFFWIADRLGSDLLRQQKAPDDTLAPDHQAILDAYVARQMEGKASAARSPVLAPEDLLDDDVPDKSDER